MSSPQLATPSLRLRRTFAAQRETVYRAWTDAGELARWFAPTPEHTARVLQLELRVGGAYRIEIAHNSGRVHIVVGTYREVHPPERLVFTWRWESRPDSKESLVTVEFHDQGDATEVLLTHDRLAPGEDYDGHSKGWNGCMDHLTRIYASPSA